MTTITEAVELYDGAIATLADGTHLVVHVVEGETGIFESLETGIGPGLRRWSWSEKGTNLYPRRESHRVVRVSDRVAPRDIEAGDFAVFSNGQVRRLALMDDTDYGPIAFMPAPGGRLRINPRTWQVFAYEQPDCLLRVVAVLNPSAVAVRS